MRKFIIILIILSLVALPFQTKALSLSDFSNIAGNAIGKIFFGGDIKNQISWSVSVSGYGVTLGPLAKIKDGESGKTLYILLVATLGICKDGGHIIGIGLSATFYGYKYLQPLIAYCDND